MLYLYDYALKNHLKASYKHVYMAEKTKLYAKIRDEYSDHNANIVMPLIGLWRTENTLQPSDGKNKAEIFTGMLEATPNEDGAFRVIRSIPVELTYQLDILGKTLMDADKLLCDATIYLTERPLVEFSFGGIGFTFSTQLIDLSLSTDYGSFEDFGEIYNHTLTVNIPTARILYIEGGKAVFRVLTDIYTETYDGIFENIVVEADIEADIEDILG